jgi:hypothetical protein
MCQCGTPPNCGCAWIGVTDPGTPNDFHAYFEVWLGDKWHVFDARFNQRIHAGRSTAVMAARLESYICGRARNWLQDKTINIILQMGLLSLEENSLAQAEEEFPDACFAAWEQGLCVARRNPKKIRSVEDLTREGVRLANREKGSGARQLLDARLREARIAIRRVGGYRDRPAAGHLSAAWRVHSGAADCCIATRSSARAFGLDFIPLTTEHYDLVLRQEHLALSAVERLLDTLTHSALRRELEGQCAYDTRETGRRMA